MFVAASQRRPGAACWRRNHARTAIWIVYGTLGAVLAAYLALLLLDPGHQYSTLVDGWLIVAVELVASGLCLARGLLWRSGRPVALTLGAGLLAWSLGDLALTIESLGGSTPPTPSAADAFYLAFFPLAYVAVVLFVRQQLSQLSTPSWLDGAVAGFGAAAVCAAFAFDSVLRLSGGGALAVAVKLAYPIGDLLLLVLVVGSTAVLTGRRKAAWFLLATGMGVNVAGDTFGLLGSSTGASEVVTAMAWPTAILVMSLAVWLPAGRPDPVALPKPPGFLLPGLAAASGLMVLVVGTLHHPHPVAVALATATLLLVGIRLALSVSGLRTLTLERQRMSLTDHLTGLGNRRYLFDVLDSFFAGGLDPLVPHHRLAFLFIDLNRFKEINDSFGHPAGDEILRQLGARLAGSLKASDALLRIGGDEFAVVLIDADADHAVTIAQRLSDSLAEPFVLDAVRPRIGASIGIALAPADATDSAGLVRCADVAMYRAKTGGSPVELYEKDLDNRGDRLHLAEELRRAIDEGQLVVHYQPQLDLRSGEISAVEALVRWAHPTLGMIPPLNFLPLAEEADLMGALTASVLTQALGQCADWRAAGYRMTVSVNVSKTNLLDDGFTRSVQNLLERHRLPADVLVLEITETGIMTEFERSKLVIQQLRDLGLVVSIDDFGAGFTSLAHLSNLSVGELKLDRTFITPLATREKTSDLDLVRATIELGHALGLRVVAEGIEDQATLDLLSDLGCDLVQGYFIATPKPANRLAFHSDLASAAPSALVA